MISLRRAKIEDFEIFKKLFTEDGGNYHFFYNTDIEEKDVEIKFEICEEDRLVLEEEYSNYTLNRFKNDLETKIIFVAEKDSKIIGYIAILASGKRGSYKIEEWAMFNPNDDKSKSEMFFELLKQKSPKIRYLIVTIISASADMFLKGIGFKPMRISGFLKYEVEKKKTR